jgi:DNA-directed RNA polymerase specialized sigma24 family protein
MPMTDSPRIALAHVYERALLQRAQAGENIRDEVILSLQPRITALASRMHTQLAQSMQLGNVIERSDLVNTANVAMLASYDVALTKENPFGYLFKAAKVAMIHCLSGRTGHAISTRVPGGPVPVLSLDKPEGNGQHLADLLAWELRLPSRPEQQRFRALQQAIEALPEKQRVVIQRCFGFGEYAPESLNQISRLFSSNPRTRSAHHYYHRALDALRQVLTLSFAQEQRALHSHYRTGGAQ